MLTLLIWESTWPGSPKYGTMEPPPVPPGGQKAGPELKHYMLPASRSEFNPQSPHMIILGQIKIDGSIFTQLINLRQNRDYEQGQKC